MDWFDKVLFKISRFCAPEGYMVAPIESFLAPDEEIPFEPPSPIVMPPYNAEPSTEYDGSFASFSGADCKIYINDIKIDNILGISMKYDTGLLRFVIYNQESIEQITNFINEKCTIRMKGANEFGKQFSISWNVVFHNNLEFDFSIDSLAFEVRLKFDVVFQDVGADG